MIPVTTDLRRGELKPVHIRRPPSWRCLAVSPSGGAPERHMAPPPSRRFPWAIGVKTALRMLCRDAEIGH